MLQSENEFIKFILCFIYKNSSLKNVYHYGIKIFIIIFSSESQIAGTVVPDNGPHGPVGINHGVN